MSTGSDTGPRTRRYLHSSTFWVLVISAPILWALVYYLLVLILAPGFR